MKCLPLTSRQPTIRGAVVRTVVGATKHENENQRYDISSLTHAPAGGAHVACHVKKTTQCLD